MMMAKIVELDNGFIVDVFDDEGLRTFNEVNIRMFTPSIGDALTVIKGAYSKLETIRKEGEIDEEQKKKRKKPEQA